MKYYAVIDTNVLVSALLKSGSAPWQVAEQALVGDIIPVLNDGIISEYEEVLKRPKFDFNTEAVDALIDDLKKRAVYSDTGEPDGIVSDPEDIIFYAVLMEKRKEEEAYLVTGNMRHYPARTFVVTPREMLEIMAKG